MKLPPTLKMDISTMKTAASLFNRRPQHLDFKQTYFIHPTFLPVIASYACENRQTGLVGAKAPIRELFKTFGLLKNGSYDPKQILPLHYLKSREPLPVSITRFFKSGEILPYINAIAEILAPATCLGHSNLAGDWQFFSICALQTPCLDDFRWHLLAEEFQMIGGRIWILQHNRFFDGKKVIQMEGYFPKTWVILGFFLTNLGS